MNSSAIVSVFILIWIVQHARSQNKDCQCWVSAKFREPCAGGAFLPDGLCQSFGCCSSSPTRTSDLGNEIAAPSCFKRLRTCHGLPQCRVQPSKRRVCPRLHWTAGSRICQFRGCCYDATQKPSCFRAESEHEAFGTIFTSQRTPFGQARDMRLIADGMRKPIETFSEVMMQQKHNYEESVAFKAALAKLAGGSKVLVQCSFGTHATLCGRPGMTRSECANMLCCWDPRVAKSVTSASLCVQPIVLEVPDNYTYATDHQDGRSKKETLVERHDQGRDGRIHYEQIETFEQPEDEYIPNSGRGRFFKSCKLVAGRELCGRKIKSRKDCVLNSCCWDKSLDSDGADAACYRPSVSYQPDSKLPGMKGEETTEWIPFDPLKVEFAREHIVFDVEKRITSAAPVAELDYNHFGVLLTCSASPTTPEGEGSSCSTANSRQLCMSLFCCWVEDTERIGEGTCVTPAVTFAKEPILEAESIPDKYLQISVEMPDFWRPSLPESNLFKDEVVLTIFCPSKTNDMKPCGDGGPLTRVECVNNGCCWRPWMLLEPNGHPPCQAPTVRFQNIAEVVVGNYDVNGDREAKWENWIKWGDCVPDAPCSSGGYQKRTRSCRTQSSFIVSNEAREVSKCLGAASEVRKCSNFVGCTVTTWTMWSPWTACSESCQVGNSVRIRTCLAPPGCPGVAGGRAREVDRRVCNSEMCAKWGRWIDNQDCDALCSSNGTSTRFRLCERFAYDEGRFAITETVVIPKSSGPKADLRALATSQPEAFAVHAKQCLVQSIPCTNKIECRYDWEAWSEWTECPDECFPGTRSRSRRCFRLDGQHDAIAVSDAFCTKLEGGADMQVEECGAQRCRKWGEWIQTTPCIAKCGESGFVIKERTCAHDDFQLAAQSNECFKKREPCHGPPCPKYEWAAWGEWAETCSSYCAPGVVSRVRRCVRFADGVRTKPKLCVGSNFDTKPCNTDFCKNWGNWTEEGCEGKCGHPGVKRSRRTCLDEDYEEKAVRKAADAVSRQISDDCFILTRRCTKRCELSWAKWGEWSECSSTCSMGYRSRSRRCMREDGEKSLSLYCSQDEEGATQKASCNTHLCEGWGKWEDGKCKGDCDKMGTRNVTRACVGRDVNWLKETYPEKGAVCHLRTAQCKPKCARWAGWTEFTNCSDPCGPGKRSRRRLCVLDGEVVPASQCRPNQGIIIDERDCNIFLCSSYSKWENDFFCIGDCKSMAVRNRTRVCYSGIAPEECLSGTVPCRPRCGPAWGPWTTWSSCNKKCGPGKRTRSRECLDGDEVLDPAICVTNTTLKGRPTDKENCNTNFCHTWSKWQRSICHAKCNQTGVMRRRRLCLQSARVEVPIDCWDDWHTCTGKCIATWGEWSRWTPCTKTCGPGKQTSVRRCTENGQVVAPKKCEKNKRPVLLRTRPCYSMMCTSWSRWTVGPCAVRCGGAGTAVRQRQCLGSGYASPPDNPTEASCYRKEEICGTDPCPNQYQPWTEWGECSNRCSPGVRRRTRKCVTNGFLLGDCSSLGPAVERRPCNERMCPKWDAWEFYTSCPRNCGAESTRRRRRTCASENYSDFEMRRNHLKLCYQSELPCNSKPCQG